MKPSHLLAVLALGASVVFPPLNNIARGQPASPQPAVTPRRPNILWLIAEDLGPELGCYGTTEVWTPNLDRLAADGVRYTRAFTTAPVCSASRSAFMTGMYQTTIGAHNHRSHRDDGFVLPVGVHVLPDWLRDSGYFTANIRAFPPPVDFKGAGKTDWNFTYQGEPFASDQWTDLKTHQPFYAQVNFEETHRNAQALAATGRAYSAPRRADPAKVIFPPYYPDDPGIRADWANYLDSATELDRKIGEVLALLESDGLADNTVVVFLGDHGQSHVRGKQWCYDSGLHIPLIIRWPKTFPAPTGFKTGTVSDQIVEAIDLAATSIMIAGAPKPAKMQGRVLFGERADPLRRYAFGARDRCGETVFRIRTVRDERYRYIRNFTPDRPFFALDRYKENIYLMIPVMRRLHQEGKLNAVQDALFAPNMPPEELYDLASDPYEIRNLAGSVSPEYQAALKRLRAKLEEWLVESDDQGRFPESAEVLAAADQEEEEHSRKVFHKSYSKDTFRPAGGK